MMKTIFKQSFTAAMLAFALLAQASPAFAQEGGTASSAQRGVCLRLTSVESVMAGRLADADKLYGDSESSRLQSVMDASAERDVAEKSSRDATGLRLEAFVAAQTGAADTGEKQAALSAFKRALQSAISARRDAIDAAQAAFWSGVRSVIEQRAAAVGEQSASFKSAIAADIAAAKAACDSGADPKEVRDDLHASLARLQQEHKDELIQSAVPGQMAQLIDARREAVGAADRAFVQQIDTAFLQLRAVIQ